MKTTLEKYYEAEYRAKAKKYNDRIRYLNKVLDSPTTKRNYGTKIVIRALMGNGTFKSDGIANIKSFSGISKLSLENKMRRLDEINEVKLKRFDYSMTEIKKFKQRIIDDTKRKYRLNDELTDEEILNTVLNEEDENWEDYKEFAHDDVMLLTTKIANGDIDAEEELRRRFISFAKSNGRGM